MDSGEVQRLGRLGLELHRKETSIVPVLDKGLQRLVAGGNVIREARPLEFLTVRQTSRPTRRREETLEVVVCLAHVGVEAFIHHAAIARCNLRDFEAANLHLVRQRGCIVGVGALPVIRAVERCDQHLGASGLSRLLGLAPNIEHPSEAGREIVPRLDHLNEEAQLLDVGVVQPVDLHDAERHGVEAFCIGGHAEHPFEAFALDARRKELVPKVAR